MYPINQAYKDAIRAASRPYDTVEGIVTFTSGTTLVVNSSNMPSNSISISKQCIDDDALMFGGVFANVLKLSIITDLERYAFYGAQIALTYKITVGYETVDDEKNPIFFEIPLGVFTVADAERPTNMVTVTCYDNMTLLSKELGSAYISGTPWEIFQLVSQNTEFELGFDAEYLEQFTNHDYQADASSERGLQTYYDVVKMICQMLGCFACADRLGRLTIKPFSVRPDAVLTTSDWYSLVPSDYTCKYVGISITSLAGTYVKHSSDLLEQGLVMVIEDAPAWDLGSDEAQQAKTENLFNFLRNIDEYTPCGLDMPSDPAFDCGDRLELVTRKGTIETLITSIEWRFHQGMSITSEGLNPYLESASTLSSEGNRLLTQAVSRSKLQFVSFTNSSQKVINNDESVKIGECVFNPSSETDALFVATIQVDVDVPDVKVTETEQVEVPVKAYDSQMQETTLTDIHGNPVSLTGIANNTYEYSRDGSVEVSVFYRLNTQMVPSDVNPYYAIDKLEGGKHIITVAYQFTALAPNQRYEFQVYMSANGGTVTLPARTLQASVIGQEITDITGFTGLIRVEEEMLFAHTVGLGIVSLSDEGALTINDAAYMSVSDDIMLYNISGPKMMSITEGSGSLQPQLFMRGDFDLATEDSNYFAAENGFRFIVG